MIKRKTWVSSLTELKKLTRCKEGEVIACYDPKAVYQYASKSNARESESCVVPLEVRGGAGRWIAVAELNAEPAPAAFTEWVAKISQTLSNAPTAAVVSQDDPDLVITWAYSTPGEYYGYTNLPSTEIGRCIAFLNGNADSNLVSREVAVTIANPGTGNVVTLKVTTGTLSNNAGTLTYTPGNMKLSNAILLFRHYKA
jgi:hypothetical protein